MPEEPNPIPNNPPPIPVQNTSPRTPISKPPPKGWSEFEPMARPDHPGAVLDALLKHPGQIIYQLHRTPALRLTTILAAIGLIGLALYGLVVGSFTGGMQWWAAPVKIAGGTFLSALICLPSLYIFACLSGAETRIESLCGTLLAAIGLNAVLLLSFTPVAWVFSQSTNSVPFMGAMHLLFWWVSLYFGLRLISGAADFIGAGDKGYLKVWFVIFVLVCLQMTTALRPIIGRAPTFLPKEKRFFLAHWVRSISRDSDADAVLTNP
jgi:hypothetical protein